MEGVHELLDGVEPAADPEVWLRTGARIARLVIERLGRLAGMLAGSGRLRAGLFGREGLDVLWSMTGSHLYRQLVDEQGWSADRYERWLGDALVAVLLSPDS